VTLSTGAALRPALSRPGWRRLSDANSVLDFVTASEKRSLKREAKLLVGRQ
jgi:hypothetical protein